MPISQSENPRQPGIQSLRQDLTDKRASVLAQKAKVEADINRSTGPIPADFAEQATAVENDEVLHALLGEIKVQLSELNHALERIDKKTYGICESCGQPIDEGRLKALPTAAACIDCAGDQE